VSLGTGASGLFACIPDHQAGCWLSGLEDVGYNGEKLSAAKKNVVDEITVAHAFQAISYIICPL
jgi:hypothetical protein